MLDAFVSYARKDRPLVRRLADALDAVGVSVWVNWQGLAPSTEWKREIERAIDAAGAFAFSLSVATRLGRRRACSSCLTHRAPTNGLSRSFTAKLTMPRYRMLLPTATGFHARLKASPPVA